MRTASAYTNRMRFQSEAKNAKVQYPGRVSATYRPGLPGVCANTSDVFIPVEYITPCCKPQPVIICPACEVQVTIYDSGNNDCSIALDGTTNASAPPIVVLDGGV